MPASQFIFWNSGSAVGSRIYTAGWYFSSSEQEYASLCKKPGQNRAVAIERISIKSLATTVIDYLQCDFGIGGTDSEYPGQPLIWYVGALDDKELIVYEPKELIGPPNAEPRILLPPGIKVGVILEGRVVKVA